MATKKSTTKKSTTKKAPAKKAASKKAASKKAASKKAASKKSADKERGELTKDQVRKAAIVAPDLGFDILDKGADIMDNAAAVMTSVAGRRKNQTIGFTPASQISHNVLWIPEFQLQWALGMVGIPHKSMVEIIGPDGVGKTSLITKFGAWGMFAGSPFFYINCEGKQLLKSRIVRCLHPDMRVAQKMMDTMRIERVFSLRHLETVILDFCNVMRGRTSLKNHPVAVPHHVPLIIAADPWSRLMNDAEAAEFYDWGKKEQGAKYKETGTGSNLGHAQFSHPWCRRLAYVLQRDNVILFLGQHQTEDIAGAIDRAGSHGPVLPQAYLAMQNATHLGGRALPQLASMQLIHGKKSDAKFPDGSRSGQYVNLGLKKSSYGPQFRKMFMEIREEFRDEAPGELGQALLWDRSFADWFGSEKFFGAQVHNGEAPIARRTYSCESLGLIEVTSEELHAAFHRDPLVRQELGRRLGIEGYVDTVERIIAAVEAEDRAEADKALAAMSAIPDTSEVDKVLAEADVVGSNELPSLEEVEELEINGMKDEENDGQ